MAQKLKKIWKNRRKIFEGILNTYFPSVYVKKVAERRLAICKSNLCGHYDEMGKSDICVVKGKGCCDLCGCNDNYKTHSLSSACSLKDVGKDPLWEAEMTYDYEQAYKKYNKIKQ